MCGCMPEYQAICSLKCVLGLWFYSHGFFFMLTIKFSSYTTCVRSPVEVKRPSFCILFRHRRLVCGCRQGGDESRNLHLWLNMVGGSTAAG